MNAVFQETLDLGYARKELIVVPIHPQHFTSYFETVTKDPKIVQAEGIQEHIGYGWYKRSIEDEDQQLEVNVMDVGPAYLQTMGLTLLEGRLCSREREDADRGVSIVVNQLMVDAFGWENPVDEQVRMNDTIMYRVTGVVKDFYLGGLWSKI